MEGRLIGYVALKGFVDADKVLTSVSLPTCLIFRR